MSPLSLRLWPTNLGSRWAPRGLLPNRLPALGSCDSNDECQGRQEESASGWKPSKKEASSCFICNPFAGNLICGRAFQPPPKKGRHVIPALQAHRCCSSARAKRARLPLQRASPLLEAGADEQRGCDFNVSQVNGRLHDLHGNVIAPTVVLTLGVACPQLSAGPSVAFVKAAGAAGLSDSCAAAAQVIDPGHSCVPMAKCQIIMRSMSKEPPRGCLQPPFLASDAGAGPHGPCGDDAAAKLVDPAAGELGPDAFDSSTIVGVVGLGSAQVAVAGTSKRL